MRHHHSLLEVVVAVQLQVFLLARINVERCYRILASFCLSLSIFGLFVAGLGSLGSLVRFDCL